MEPHQRLDQAMEIRRLELGLNWKEVAAAAGIAVESIGAIRRGKHRPSALTARKLDNALQWAHGTVLSFYPDEAQKVERRSTEQPGQEVEGDDEIDLDTFVPESPAEKALMAIYRASQQEEANRQAIQDRLDELTRKLDEQGKKLEELRSERSRNGSDEPRRSA